MYDGDALLGEGGSEKETEADGGRLVCTCSDEGMCRLSEEEVAAGMRRKLLAEWECDSGCTRVGSDGKGATTGSELCRVGGGC